MTKAVFTCVYKDLYNFLPPFLPIAYDECYKSCFTGIFFQISHLASVFVFHFFSSESRPPTLTTPQKKFFFFACEHSEPTARIRHSVWALKSAWKLYSVQPDSNQPIWNCWHDQKCYFLCGIFSYTVCKSFLCVRSFQ